MQYDSKYPHLDHMETRNKLKEKTLLLSNPKTMVTNTQRKKQKERRKKNKQFQFQERYRLSTHINTLCTGKPKGATTNLLKKPENRHFQITNRAKRRHQRPQRRRLGEGRPQSSPSQLHSSLRRLARQASSLAELVPAHRCRPPRRC